MTAVGSFTVGEVLTAASLNEIGAWTTYTPTIGGVTTSSVTGKSYKMNKIGFCYVSFTLSAAPTAAVTISWPSSFTPANTATTDAKGIAMYYDLSATAQFGCAVRTTATNWRIAYYEVSGTSILYTDLTNTKYPVLPASGDIISFMWVGEVS